MPTETSKDGLLVRAIGRFSKLPLISRIRSKVFRSASFVAFFEPELTAVAKAGASALMEHCVREGAIKQVIERGIRQGSRIHRPGLIIPGNFRRQ